MPRLRHTVEQIFAKLPQAEVALRRQFVAHVCRTLSIIEQAYYGCHKGSDGLKVDQINRSNDWNGRTPT